VATPPRPKAAKNAAAAVEPVTDADLDEELEGEEPVDAAAEGEEPVVEEGDEEVVSAEGIEGEAPSPDEQPGEGDPLTLAELAGQFEVDVDQLAANVTVEGPDGVAVPLATVLTEYANQPAATAAAEQFDARRLELDSSHSDRMTSLDAELNRATGLVQVLIKEVQGAQPDWDTMRRDLDPDEFLRRKENWLARDEKIRQALDQLGNHADARDEDTNSRLKSQASAEMVKLQRVMPAWRNQERATSAMSEMKTYLKDVRGFEDSEIDLIIDHRHVMVIWDAMHGHKAKGARPKALERIRGAKQKVALSRSVGGAARAEPRSAAAKRRASAKARLKRTGSVEDAAVALEGLL